MTEREALKLALEALQKIYIAPEHEEYIRVWWPACEQAITAIKEALAQPAVTESHKQEPVTVLPDGSAFAVMSFPLPKNHWLYAERQYNDGEYEPAELGKAILTHEMRDAVVSAVRYAIRGATNCGKENDFDPDALVKNAVYALCGPYTSALPQRTWVGLTDEEISELIRATHNTGSFVRAIEAKLKEKNT